MSNANYYLKQLEKLIGATIVATAATKPNDLGDEYFGIVVEMPNKSRRKVILFTSDDEGNGPGAFEIQDAK